MNKIVISHYDNLIYSALLNEKDQLVELMMDTDESRQLIGGVYIGKVMTIQKGIRAAFIDIGLDQHVFMPVGEKDVYLYTTGKEKQEALRQGDQLVVQIIKEGNDVKAPKVSPKINIASEHVVLTFGNSYVGVSNKITDPKEKKRLKKLFKPFFNQDYGFVIRTNAEGVEADVIQEEIQYLITEYKRMVDVMAFRPYRSILRETETTHELFIKNAYKPNIEEIQFDDLRLYEGCSHIKATDLPCNYVDCGDYSLYQRYNMKKYIDKALGKRLWLKSGANITIEQTEALVAIDVNSAKVVVKKASDDFFLGINKEAADKVMEQIRLRNLSGIIIVDFIDMPLGAHKKELLDHLRHLAEKDRIKTEIIDMTKLGLVEIVRKKAYKPLKEQFTTYSH